jgi:hypothetical protein
VLIEDHRAQALSACASDRVGNIPCSDAVNSTADPALTMAMMAYSLSQPQEH